MNIDDAVRVLARERHGNKDRWTTDGDIVVGRLTNDAVRSVLSLSPFEAIAIAEAYERQAGRDMPATRKLVRVLVNDARRSGRGSADLVSLRLRRSLLEKAVAEWSDQPNSSTETDA